MKRDILLLNISTITIPPSVAAYTLLSPIIISVVFIFDVIADQLRLEGNKMHKKMPNKK